MLTDGLVVDRYVVEHRLGAGGQASVYRVRHRTLGTLHALKVLTITGPRLVDRFVQEGKVQARLRHPNIVAVTDVFDVGGSPGLLMEYIAGPALDRRLMGPPLTIAEVESIFRGIVAGVGFAHAQGVVHRDLKPANVLLEEGVPKVADFGLAKVLEDLFASIPDQHTRSGTAMGTPAYMAPEQVRDARSVDARADLWSLGCILYELLTGRRPFDGPDMYAIFNAVVNGAYVPLEKVRPDLPRRWGTLVRALLETDRERRLPDVAQLVRMLDEPDPHWAAPTLAPAADTFLAAPGGGVAPGDAATLVGLPTYTPDSIAPRPAAAPTGVPGAPTRAEPKGAPPGAATGPRRTALPGLLGVGLVGLVLVGAWWLGASSTAQDAGTTAPPEGSASSPVPLRVEPHPGAPDARVDLPAPAAPTTAPTNPPTPTPTPPRSASAPAAAVPGSPAPPAATKAPANALPAAAAGSGTLKVNAIPWATVRVDGARKAEGAWSGEVSEGTHSVTLTTADGTTHTQSVSVSAGGVTNFCWNFELDARCLD